MAWLYSLLVAALIGMTLLQVKATYTSPVVPQVHETSTHEKTFKGR